MKNKIKNVLKSGFLIILMISGFYFYNQLENYRSRPPVFSGSMVEPFREKGVYVTAKAYDAHESIAYLDRDLLDQGFQPIQITIQNNTHHEFVLSKKGVDLNEVSTSKVANTFTRQSIPRSIGLKVAAFFFWPFIIPSAVDTIFTVKNHRQMKNDYFAKSVKEEGEIIAPYSTVHRILFLPKSHTPDLLTIYLQNHQNGHYYSYSTKIEIA